MDQIKIGKFIAEERKAKKYTQRELADKLSISDKTISKWERGNGFPEVSLLLPLCNELEITVNELLSGERLQAMDYKMILSILVDTFISKISLPMQPVPEIRSISGA